MNEILQRLKSGETLEDIAAQITNDINKANAEFQRLEAEIQKKREERNIKIRAAQNFLDAFFRLGEVWNADKQMMSELQDAVDAELLADAIDEVMRETPLGDLLKKENTGTEKEQVDPILEFLYNNGLRQTGR